MIEGLKRRLLGHERYARRAGVRIGQDCRILSSNFGSEPFLVKLGDRVTVSFNVIFLTHDGASWLIRDAKGRRYIYRAVTVGSDVFIGAGSIIMPGINIGDRSIVAAGAVVTKSIPSGSVVGGNPAKIIGTYAAYREKVLAYPSQSDWKQNIHANDFILSALDRNPRATLSDNI